MEESKVIMNPEDRRPLPMTPEEVQERGWQEVDIVFVTGDAYVDHPSFAAGILSRVLEAAGYKVAILSQPDWHSPKAWTTFGRPRLGFCVSAGNMDSMINHYTANRKVRNADAYSPNGEIGHRPDRATLSYCQRSREAYPGIPIIVGGVEASLRRTAHYDYWSDRVRRSILLDSKASLLSYGMGESTLLEIFRRLDSGEPIETIRDVRGTVYRLGKSEDLPEETETLAHLPSFDEAEEDKQQFAQMTKIIWENLNPYTAKTLVQEHGDEAVVINPPSFPLSSEEMDRIYGLPFTRKPHPFYAGAPIPAFEVIKDSVTCMRGCFGGCAFCSITAHQGKFIQSRSEQSVLNELKEIAEQDDFHGTISDIGGPTANMYQLGCSNPEMKKVCQRPSCLWPEICPNLNTDQKPLIQLMQKAREVPNVKNVFIASGVRTDLAIREPKYIEELIKFHIGGHLKTAPEHVDPNVLNLMHKPPIEKYEEFCDFFAEATERNGKEIYLVPYLIAGLPGSNYQSMIEVAEYLKANDIRPEQVQDFIPTPFEIATCMYYTGLDPFTGERVYVPRKMRERRLQHALLMYYNPAYFHDVKSALKEAHREDLIGEEPNCLIPAYLSKIEMMRQSSRIKRLKKQTEAEKIAKEEYREKMREEARLEELKQKKKNRASRPGGGTGGYRGTAKRFGRSSEEYSGDVRPGTEKRFGRSSFGSRPFGGGRSGGFHSDRKPREFNREEGAGSGLSPAGQNTEGRSEKPFNRDSNDRGERRFNRDSNDRGERRFNRDSNDRGERRFNRDSNDRGERRFNRDSNDRGERRFNRDSNDRGERRFNRDSNDQGERSFNRDSNDRGERRFNRDSNDRGERSFNRDSNDRGERRFNRDSNDRGERRFNRDSNDRGERRFNRDSNDRGERRFNRDSNDRGERRFNRDSNDRGERRFNRDSNDRGERRFNRDSNDRGERRFNRDSNDRGERRFNRDSNDRGERRFNRDSNDRGERRFNRDSNDRGERRFNRDSNDRGERRFNRDKDDSKPEKNDQ